MITALVSTVLGIVGGAIPDVLKEWRESREHAREIERLKVQSELQLRLVAAQTDAKLAEIQASTAVEEVRAFARQMEAIYRQQQPVGIRWVDGFNALIRPATAALLMLLFVATAGAYVWSVLAQFGNGIIDLKGASEIVWGSLVGEAIQAVLGYLFGYRTTSAAVAAARGERPVAGLPWRKGA